MLRDLISPFVLTHSLYPQNVQQQIDPNLLISKVLEFWKLMPKQFHRIYQMTLLEQIVSFVELDFEFRLIIKEKNTSKFYSNNITHLHRH
jgi:hypothetical protein